MDAQQLRLAGHRAVDGQVMVDAASQQVLLGSASVACVVCGTRPSAELGHAHDGRQRRAVALCLQHLCRQTMQAHAALPGDRQKLPWLHSRLQS